MNAYPDTDLTCGPLECALNTNLAFHDMNLACFQIVTEITLVVLRPSDRLFGPSTAPIIVLLWIQEFSVRFRVENAWVKSAFWR